MVSTCYTVKFYGPALWDRKVSVLAADTKGNVRLAIWEDYDHFFAMEVPIAELAKIRDEIDAFLKNAEAEAKVKEPMPF